LKKEPRIYVKVCSMILVAFSLFYLTVLIYISVKFLKPELAHLNIDEFKWIAIGHIFFVYMIFGLIFFSFMYAGIGILSLKRKARKIALWATGVNFLSLLPSNYEWRANVTRILLILASLVIYYCLLKKSIRAQFK